MVVLGSHAVVDPRAMVVKALNALIADAAVPRPISSDHLAIGAKEHGVEILKHIDEGYFIVARQIPRVSEGAQGEEYYSEAKEY